MLSQSWEWAKIREQEWLQWYKLEPNARATDLRLQTQSVLHKLLNRADDHWTRPSRRHGRNRAPRPCLALFHLPDRPQPGPRTARPAAHQPPHGGTSPCHLASSHSSLGFECHLLPESNWPISTWNFSVSGLAQSFQESKGDRSTAWTRGPLGARWRLPTPPSSQVRSGKVEGCFKGRKSQVSYFHYFQRINPFLIRSEKKIKF